MQRFNKKAFAFVFSIALGIWWIWIDVEPIVITTYTVVNISVGTLFALLASATASALIASYELFLRYSVWAYRAVMRALAVRALRLVLRYDTH